MADQFVKFVSKTELNAKKEEKRKAREQLLQQVRLHLVFVYNICYFYLMIYFITEVFSSLILINVIVCSGKIRV